MLILNLLRTQNKEIASTKEEKTKPTPEPSTKEGKTDSFKEKVLTLFG